MSRAFVKEPNGDEDDLPQRPRSPHTNYVTPQGLRYLQARLSELLAAKSALAGRDDLADRQQIRAVERDLRYYEERIERAVMVNPEIQPEDRVHFGATVEVLDEEGAVHPFTIVGEDEADVAQGKISWVSPLAKALLNARVGDVVTWRRPVGDKELQILSIQKAIP
ncbi:MAG TPA: GreA/GreB family elongation factor [Methylococcaceae bacterium]|jgi:transcription elongation GreA/GreB family factor|nr:GreA/GreB family elongation factor [Methylococcaceae bacterium]